MGPPTSPAELPLFPLRMVLFPDGLLQLKVFEARYLDLMGDCLRTSKPFGVVTLQGGSEVQRDKRAVNFEPIGTIAELLDVDSERQGILLVRCRGAQRFQVEASHQQAGGLWVAQAGPLPRDERTAPDASMAATVRGLANAIAAMKADNVVPFLEPYRYDDAGWVANRWCEILPISVSARHKLMALPDPLRRLRLVDDYLRSKGAVTPTD